MHDVHTIKSELEFQSCYQSCFSAELINNRIAKLMWIHDWNVEVRRSHQIYSIGQVCKVLHFNYWFLFRISRDIDRHFFLFCVLRMFLDWTELEKIFRKILWKEKIVWTRLFRYLVVYNKFSRWEMNKTRCVLLNFVYPYIVSAGARAKWTATLSIEKCL